MSSRIAYLGPPGTFSHEALLSDLAVPPAEEDLVPYPSIYEAVMAVEGGEVDSALVPIENSLGGAVPIALDTLVLEARDVRIRGEVVQGIGQCLIVKEPIELHEIKVVLSHPQASAQCAGFLRRRLPGAEVRACASTAEAVRLVAAVGDGQAALGSRLAAAHYGGHVLVADVEDVPGNETRFAWLTRENGALPARRSPGGGGAGGKTVVVFWGPGTEAAGWLVGCLSEFADRGVNLTRIESRPRRQGLGQYMFFIDVDGVVEDTAVDEALEGVRAKVEELRVLGSFS